MIHESLGRGARLARAGPPSAEALRLHRWSRGKRHAEVRHPRLRRFRALVHAGVAAPCRAIAAAPKLAYAHANKGNSGAIVTDGTPVRGLGDIGPAAALPVMEGKALLIEYLGGVDAIPPRHQAARRDHPDPRPAREPAFGAINFEDIAQPTCFRILDRRRARMAIPVGHDDQHCSPASSTRSPRWARRATACAWLWSAWGGQVAGYRLLTAGGMDPAAVLACDSKGTLPKGRHDPRRSGAVLDALCRIPISQFVSAIGRCSDTGSWWCCPS